MHKTCTQCSAGFDVTDEDLAFYDKVSPIFNDKKELIPPPTLCPNCRQQRRMAFRNERHLYHRKCDLTGKQIISMYAPESPLTVYEKSAWWSDRWDALSYGKEFDFSRPFFDQYEELHNIVPRPSLYQKNVENSDYTNHVENLKNGYLSVDVGAGSEDIYYSKWIIASKNICDSYQLENAELCYECLYSVGDFRCTYVYLSDRCSDSAFLYDCQDCNSCFLCSNLRHKQFCFENTQYTEEEYRSMMREIDLGSSAVFQSCLMRYADMLQHRAIHRDCAMIGCEDCTGDFLYKCKNVRDSFEVIESQDVRYCYEAGALKDCYDIYESAFDCNLQYDSYSCNRATSILFTGICYDASNLLYSNNCHNSHDLFGCIGMKRHQYCILNKQYTKKEYEELVPKIIEHMRHDGGGAINHDGVHGSAMNPSGTSGSWGEHFPVGLSPFGYNETVAQDYFPLSKEVTQPKGWKWHDEESQEEQYLGPKTVIPDNIKDVSDDIVKLILRCEQTEKPYKIIPQELKFYHTMNLPIPRTCPDERHKNRMALRNPRAFWNRACAKCTKMISTSFAPERPEIVYCEECYLETIY